MAREAIYILAINYENVFEISILEINHFSGT